MSKGFRSAAVHFVLVTNCCIYSLPGWSGVTPYWFLQGHKHHVCRSISLAADEHTFIKLGFSVTNNPSHQRKIRLDENELPRDICQVDSVVLNIKDLWTSTAQHPLSSAISNSIKTYACPRVVITFLRTIKESHVTILK